MRINIIGAGLSGLSAALFSAERGICCNLISSAPSERAQSIMAEGGINGALNTMGENDTPDEHMKDTMRAGGDIADSEAVKGLTKNAPDIIRFLGKIGVPFNLRDGEIQLRNFGGQKKKRTAYAKSSTGKVIMSALIDELRGFETEGIVKRYPRHEFISLYIKNGICKGVEIKDNYTGERIRLYGAVILASGGLNGFFPEMTTGTALNTGDVTAKVFSQGVKLSNLEMIQYHPTTIKIVGKRCLISEAARGEGGRLEILRDGKPWYFMEEKYPELGNLMPRDIVSREIYNVLKREDTGDKVFLDMTGLSEEIWKRKLPDLRSEIIHYLSEDPKKKPISVEPAIHYFMGGIAVDVEHRTNIEGLYAAGECCMQYHGANRLGGNSMLGAVYGGFTAAKALINSSFNMSTKEILPETGSYNGESENLKEASPVLIKEVRDILISALGIVRNEKELLEADDKIDKIITRNGFNEREKNRLYTAKAMIISAILRKESRGAHFREDYPERNDEYRGMTEALFKNGKVEVSFKRFEED